MEAHHSLPRVTCAFSSTTGRLSSRRRRLRPRSHMSQTLCQANNHSSQPLFAAPPRHSEQRSLLTAPSLLPMFAAPTASSLSPVVAAPSGSRMPCPPSPASACHRLAKVCRPALNSLTPFTVLRALAQSCQRAYHVLFWPAVTSQPFLLPSPSRRSPLQPRSAALPDAPTYNLNPSFLMI